MTIPLSETLLVVIVSSAASGGVIWGLLRGDVSRLAEDMRAVKKAMGLEPSNGKIEAAFIPRSECGLKEQRVEERLSGCEDSIEDHEHRIVAMERVRGARP